VPTFHSSTSSLVASPRRWHWTTAVALASLTVMFVTRCTSIAPRNSVPASAGQSTCLSLHRRSSPRNPSTCRSSSVESVEESPYGLFYRQRVLPPGARLNQPRSSLGYLSMPKVHFIKTLLCFSLSHASRSIVLQKSYYTFVACTSPESPLLSQNDNIRAALSDPADLCSTTATCYN